MMIDGDPAALRSHRPLRPAGQAQFFPWKDRALYVGPDTAAIVFNNVMAVVGFVLNGLPAPAPPAQGLVLTAVTVAAAVAGAGLS